MQPVASASTPLINHAQAHCCRTRTYLIIFTSTIPSLVSLGTGLFSFTRDCKDDHAKTMALAVTSIFFGIFSITASCCFGCRAETRREEPAIAGFVGGVVGLVAGLSTVSTLHYCDVWPPAK